MDNLHYLFILIIIGLTANYFIMRSVRKRLARKILRLNYITETQERKIVLLMVSKIKAPKL